MSRVYQCALAYPVTPSTDFYLFVGHDDGAARTLLTSGNQTLIERALPHLVTRNRDEFWTAGKWMTELTGRSDVSSTEAVAKKFKKQEPFDFMAQMVLRLQSIGTLA